ncbi:Sensor kinase CckA [subsurface metagenome]
MADSTQIFQVIMNLCTNAYQAMKEKGGILELTLSEVHIGNEEKGFSILKPGPYLLLIVSDMGHGMSRGVMERIFDPFFTTRGPAEGTGMGLSVVHGIVKSHGGDIKVYSEPGKGATFNVYLPRIDNPSETPDISAAESSPTGTEHILLVDDEEAIARMLERMLMRLGYRVTARTGSVEALEAFRSKPENFDLVIADITMPNMSGIDLSEELLRIRADIPIVLCTGFSETVSREKAIAVGVRDYIMKPFVSSRIAATIRRVLDKERKE